MSIACSSSSSSHSVPPGRRYLTLVSRPGCCTSWREDCPFGHSVPWLIGERGLPSMSTNSPSRVYTNWPHPTAQNGHTDSVPFTPPILASALRVTSEAALGPRPQSIARPTSGSRRSDSNERGRAPDGLITFHPAVRRFASRQSQGSHAEGGLDNTTRRDRTGDDPREPPRRRELCSRHVRYARDP